MFANKICIKDSTKQIDDFWLLREQMFIDKSIFGEYFDSNTNKLLLDKNLITYRYVLANGCSRNNFIQIIRNKNI